MTITAMSPAKRIKNAYESTYYQTPSHDPVTDEHLRSAILRSFEQHDVILADKPSMVMLDAIMLTAYDETAKELYGDVTEQKMNEFRSEFLVDFSAFKEAHSDFYDVTFATQEARYYGETVDFHADLVRADKERNIQNVTGSDLEAMQESLQSTQPFSTNGFSYGSYVPDAALEPSTQAYQIGAAVSPIAESESIVESDLSVDTPITEHDYDQEDEGPSL